MSIVFRNPISKVLIEVGSWYIKVFANLIFADPFSYRISFIRRFKLPYFLMFSFTFHFLFYIMGNRNIIHRSNIHRYIGLMEQSIKTLIFI